MQSRWFHRPLLHSPALGLEKRATWLELFYDLIFVAAFIQLGNGLSEHVSLRGVGVFSGSFVALWVAWTGFTFYENRFTLDDFFHRILVLLQMFAVGAMAISAPGLLEGELTAFAIASGVAQLLVAMMYLRAHAQVPEARDYSRYWGLVFALGGLAWLLSAALPALPATVLAGLATLGVLVSPLSSQSRELAERFPLDFEHLGERYGLLTIIVLGESFVKVLSELASQGGGPSLYVQGAIVLLVTSGLWWVYFDDVAGSHVRHGRGQWVVWLYAHVPLQIGVTATGVAVKKAVHFDWAAPAPVGYRFLLAGSLSLAYLAVAMLDSVTERRQAELSDRARVNARAASGLSLLLLAPAGAAMSGGMFLSLVMAVNVAQVVFDMMLAPMVSSEHAELGIRTTADIVREEIDRGGEGPQRRSRPRVQVGQALRKGAPAELRRDLYFYFIEGSWWRVAAGFSFLFFFLNVGFAALYVMESGSIEGAAERSFRDAFFFSVQTMSTIGYGAMSPGTGWANLVVTVEAAVGMVGVAVVTGLVFAKLSRPRSGILFSEPLVVTTVNGKRVLMLRAGNTRGNEVVDASVSLSVLMDELTDEGQHFRRVRELKLVRDRNPVFMLSWAIMHELDVDSPLSEVDWDAPIERIVAFVVTIIGHDGTYGQTTYARKSYTCDDLRVGSHFVDIIHELADGRLMVDYGHFHDVEPDA